MRHPPKRHVVAMHVVESLHELPEVEPGNILGEATRLGHEVKEFSSRDELKHKVVDVLGALVRVDHLSIFLLNHVDNIRVDYLYNLAGWLRFAICKQVSQPEMTPQSTANFNRRVLVTFQS